MEDLFDPAVSARWVVDPDYRRERQEEYDRLEQKHLEEAAEDLATTDVGTE